MFAAIPSHYPPAPKKFPSSSIDHIRLPFTLVLPIKNPNIKLLQIHIPEAAHIQRHQVFARLRDIDEHADTTVLAEAVQRFLGQEGVSGDILYTVDADGGCWGVDVEVAIL